MNNALKIIKKRAHSVRLSAAEKGEMKGALRAYVAAHPPLIVSPLSRGSVWRNNKTLPVLITLGLLMGSSVSFAAENTLPGDPLYPVKIYVNENVRGALAVTPEARADWGVRLVERRLVELEKITTRQSAAPRAAEVAQTNFEKYTERAGEHITILEHAGKKEKALAVSARLAQEIRLHENSLKGQVREERDTTPQSPQDTRSAVSSRDARQEFSDEEDSPRVRTLRRIEDVRERAEQRDQELQRRIIHSESALED